MKPERLILSAWGPYAEEADVDFKSAGEEGLFLITGPTGSGKTTLFDGISFALFGEVSGSIRENSSLRSDFATAERDTFVRLFFVHKNQRYEIYRSPRYERAKKRGSGKVSQTEKAELYCGGVLQASGAREVTEAMQRLLSLNAVQFKQVSMIAQGEFHKLLIAGAKERTQIFRTIFHTKQVETVTRLLGEQAKSLYISYNNLMQRIKEAMAGIETGENDELSAMCKAEFDERILPCLSEIIGQDKKKYRKLEKEVLTLEKEAEAAALVLDRVRNRQRLLRDIALLTEKAEHLEAELVGQEAEYEKLLSENSAERLLHAETELMKKQEEKAACMKWKQEKQILSQEETTLEKLQGRYLVEEKKEKEKQLFYEQAFSRYRRMSAGILARDLQEGEPCPVCGSLQHPCKAEEAESISQEELDGAKADWDSQREKTAKLHAEAAESYAKVRAHRELVEQAEKDLPEEERILAEEKELLEKKAYYKDMMKRMELLHKALEEKRLLKERNQAQKETLEAELLRCPAEATEYSEEKLTECRAQIEKLEREKKTLHARITVNERALQSIEDKLSEVQSLKKRYGVVSDVEQLVKGNNPKRLVWEQYVLSVYFDVMLHAANLRLAPMSDGRYEMFRVESVGDLRSRDSLEIEVLDHYTGKRRSAKSLSGGEAFKAALSLALGMSDMIQSYAGGIEVDALFIDEGFGGLDGQSLEQALNVLQGLTKKNCMIGIISHVQELKDRIEKQIVVEKTNTGSRVKG